MDTPTSCLLCGFRGIQYLFTRGEHPNIRFGEYSFYACNRCGVHFLGNRDIPEDPYRVEKAHTTPAWRDGDLHWEAEIVRVFEKLAPRGRLLDLGSGFGEMLTAAKTAGYDPEGVDVSPHFAEEARRRTGCSVFVGVLEEAKFPTGHFRIVNANCVFEYVPTMVETFREIARILEPGGFLRVYTFRVDCLSARLRGGDWWWYAPTRRFIFSSRTFRWLAKESGLRLERVAYGGEQTHGSFLRERKHPTLAQRAGDSARFVLRRAHLGRWAIGAAAAFYLQR
jgi:SAM-dependent methyltransferase